MKNKTVAFYTLGCKVNQYETNAMIQEFKKANYTIVEFEEKADVYVINTCTVTNMADRKSRQMLRRVKEINPEAIVVAVGCYAQVAKEELEKIPEIDLILGNNEKKDVITFTEKMLEARANKKENEKVNKSIVSINVEEESESKIKNNIKKSNITDVLHCEEYVDFGDVTFTEKTRAVIKVQDGCDRFCSYCIIPFARGHIRSRKPESVVSEIKKIAKQGIKEVVITGIHLASYGRDFKAEELKKISVTDSKLSESLNLVEKQCKTKEQNKGEQDRKENSRASYGLINLLEEINKIEGIQRIRLRFLRAYTDN